MAKRKKRGGKRKASRKQATRRSHARKSGTTKRRSARRSRRAAEPGYVVYEPGPAKKRSRRRKAKKASPRRARRAAPRRRRARARHVAVAVAEPKRKRSRRRKSRRMVPRSYAGRSVTVQKRSNGKRRLVRRVYRVRDNPSMTGKGMTAAAVGLLLGVVGSSFADRFVATRFISETVNGVATEAPKEGNAIFGTAAIRRIVSRADGARLATSGGGAVVLGTVGYLLRKKPIASLFFWGAALGFATKFIDQTFNGWLMPKAFAAQQLPNTTDKGLTDNLTLGNRLFPEGQDWAYTSTTNPNTIQGGVLNAARGSIGGVRSLPAQPTAAPARPQFAGSIAAPPVAQPVAAPAAAAPAPAPAASGPTAEDVQWSMFTGKRRAA